MDSVYKDIKQATWVMDNFSSHKAENFYQVFPLKKAKEYLNRMTFVYTLKHGSWLNMAEIEFSVITRQEFDRPFGDKDIVKK